VKRKIKKKKKKISVKPWGKTPKERNRLKRKFEEVELSELKIWEGNPRFNEKAVEPLAELIKEHGFTGVIIATPDGTIWAGNTRFKALELLEWEKVWVEWKDFESLKAAEEFALADNKSSEWAEWDHAKLSKMFQKRKKIDIARIEKATGFKKQDIEWQGAEPIPLEEIDPFEEPDQTYILRIEKIQQKDKDRLVERIEKALKGTGYEAEIY